MPISFTAIDTESYEGFFPHQMGKSAQTRLRILEGAIKSFAHNGLERTTFTEIAQHSKVSRPLVVHYFDSMDDILINAVQLITYKFLNFLNEQDNSKGTALDKLKIFVVSYLTWHEHFPDESKTMMLFSYASTTNKIFKNYHSLFLDNGIKQITRLLKSANEQKEIACKNTNHTALLIMTYLVGAATLLTSTNINQKRSPIQSHWRHCCQLAKDKI